MRRFVLPGLLLLSLSACASSGFPQFIADTHTWSGNPNLPPEQSLNMQRVQALNAPFVPIGLEPGTIWPGPPPPMKNLYDLQNEQSNGTLPPVSTPSPDVGSPNYQNAR